MTQPKANIDFVALFDALISHAASSGYFDRVATHEPKNAPGKGLTAAIIAGPFGPARGASGLSLTTCLFVTKLRIFIHLNRQPADSIDADLMTAAAGLMAAYSNDFELDGLIRDVDLLAAFGTPLSAIPGYLEQDGTKFRIADITIPLVINDVFVQAP
jgi:hypothetical protein